jgi:hypothetical protein
LIVETLKTLLSDVVSPLEVASLRAKVPANVESAAFKVMVVSIYSAAFMSEFTQHEQRKKGETYDVRL